MTDPIPQVSHPGGEPGVYPSTRPYLPSAGFYFTYFWSGISMLLLTILPLLFGLALVLVTDSTWHAPVILEVVIVTIPALALIAWNIVFSVRAMRRSTARGNITFAVTTILISLLNLFILAIIIKGYLK